MDADPQAPVPVVVPLASWAVDQPPLEKWLATELLHYYRLSARTTPGLLAEGKRLTLLLDGLDEVQESARPACLTAIQRFMEHFTGAVVLCCRTREFAALPARLSRGESIRVLPLTPEQIDKYFDDLKCGARLDNLRKMVKDDPHWRELAATPLMLNLLAVVYATEEGPREPPQGREAIRDAIFFRYVRQMLQRKEHRTTAGQVVPEEAPFSKGQAVHWLQQVARCMVKVQSTTFYIERLQPTWLLRRWKYGLLFGLFIGLFFGPFYGLRGALITGLFFGLFFGLITVGVQLVESVRFRFDRWQMILGLFIGLLFGLIGWLLAWLSNGLLAWLRGELRGWLSSGLSGGMRSWLSTELGCGLVGAVILGLFKMQSHPQPSRPNQGIRNSIKTTLFAAGLGGVLGSVLGLALGRGQLGATVVGFWIGLTCFGGQSVIQHYAIRLALAWEGTLPFPLRDRRLIAFLDALRDRLLLTRVGGGWVFIHRELMDYLATEPFGSTPAEVEQTLQRGKVPSKNGAVG